MSELTVIIPAYKSEEVLGRTLDSVLEQKRVDCSIIVIEDGVFDNTADVVRQRSNVQLIQKQTNKGVARARNCGLKKVATPYVIFIDSDDFIEGDYFRSAMDLMTANNFELLLAPWRVVHERGGRSQVYSLPEAPTCYEVLCKFLAWDFAAMSTPARVFWRTDTLRKLGGWNERLCKREDENLMIRALTSCVKIGASHGGVCNYWKPSSGLCRSAQNAGKSEAFHETMDMILEFSSNLDDDAAKQHIRKLMGERAYKQAYIDYCGGYDRQGQLWLQRARTYGFRGHDGTIAHRIAATVLGLDLKFRLSRRGHQIMGKWTRLSAS